MSGWTYSGNVSSDNTVYERGSSALKIYNSTTVFRYAQSDKWLPAIPGRTYKARVFAKGDSIGTVSYGAIMKFLFIKEDGTTANGGQSPLYKSGTFGWEELSAASIAPANAVGVKIRVCLYDIGTVWFDNIQLFQTPNIMPNPGFEGDPSSDYSLGGFEQVSDCSYSGASSIYENRTTDGLSSVSAVKERLPVVSGKQLKVTIYAKTDNIAGGTINEVIVKTHYYDSSGTYISRHVSPAISGNK